MYSIKTLREKLLKKELTIEQVFQYVEKKKEENVSLNALIASIPLTDYKPYQEAYDNQKNRPLEGIPVVLKDNFALKGYKMTCGSKMLENFFPNYNSTVVQKLIDAGAVIVGKASLDEFAMGSYGNHCAFGNVYSPWGKINNKKILPGGSSSGSAVSVASGIAMVALGTETGGSVRVPASFCGLVGLKPTYGTCSRYGMVSYGSSLDVPGIFGRTTDDVEAVFDVIKGQDENDSTSVFFPSSPIKKIKDLKIAIVKNLSYGNHCISKAFEKIEKYLKEAGIFVDYIEIPNVDYSIIIYCIIAWMEATSNFARYDGIKYGLTVEKDMDNLEEYYAKVRSEGFGKEVQRRILASSLFSSPEYKTLCYDQSSVIRQDFCDFFQKSFEHYDFLIYPTTANEAIDEEVLASGCHSEMEERYTDLKTVLANLTGLPAITVPIDICEEHILPSGLHIMGPQFSEKGMFDFCRFLEERFSILNKMNHLLNLK